MIRDGRFLFGWLSDAHPLLLRGALQGGAIALVIIYHNMRYILGIKIHCLLPLLLRFLIWPSSDIHNGPMATNDYRQSLQYPKVILTSTTNRRPFQYTQHVIILRIKVHSFSAGVLNDHMCYVLDHFVSLAFSPRRHQRLLY